MHGGQTRGFSPRIDPFGIEIQTEKLQNTVNENVKPTDFAELFEERVRKECDEEDDENQKAVLN